MFEGLFAVLDYYKEKEQKEKELKKEKELEDLQELLDENPEEFKKVFAMFDKLFGFEPIENIKKE